MELESFAGIKNLQKYVTVYRNPNLTQKIEASTCQHSHTIQICSSASQAAPDSRCTPVSLYKQQIACPGRRFIIMNRLKAPANAGFHRFTSIQTDRRFKIVNRRKPPANAGLSGYRPIWQAKRFIVVNDLMPGNRLAIYRYGTWSEVKNKKNGINSTGWNKISSWLARLARQMQYSLATPQHDSRQNGSLTIRD